MSCLYVFISTVCSIIFHSLLTCIQTLRTYNWSEHQWDPNLSVGLQTRRVRACLHGPSGWVHAHGQFEKSEWQLNHQGCAESFSTTVSLVGCQILLIHATNGIFYSVVFGCERRESRCTNSQPAGARIWLPKAVHVSVVRTIHTFNPQPRSCTCCMGTSQLQQY